MAVAKVVSLSNVLVPAIRSYQKQAAVKVAKKANMVDHTKLLEALKKLPNAKAGIWG